MSVAYSGQLTCQLNAEGIFPPGTVTGPVAFRLERSLDGNFLDVGDGTTMGGAGE